LPQDVGAAVAVEVARAPDLPARARWSKAGQALSESGNHLRSMLSDTEAIILASAILGVAWLAMM
jgi:hypothetical protein